MSKVPVRVTVGESAKKPVRSREHGRPAADPDEAPPPEVHPVYRSPRGMHDILPADQPYWEVLSDLVRQTATSFGFHHIETSAVESQGLFERSLGPTSDVARKELFVVRDRSGKERLTLRPELTAGIVRAYLEHGMHVRPQPVRLWYFSSAFRHERPQAGRFRQFWQFGVEAIGDGHPIIDAQVIHLAYEILHSLQLEHFRIELNSLGHPAAGCRLEYVQLLKTHAHANVQKLCKDCKVRLKKNPLRILDCKEEKCRVVANTAPKLTEHLCNACAAHFTAVKALLGEMRIPFKENPHLVRGLDYYTRTVFEVVPQAPRPADGSAQPAPGVPDAHVAQPATILAGGRYDELVELFGGSPTPAVGFSGGVERVIQAMKNEGVEARRTDVPEVYLVHLGELGRKRALALYDELRRAGFRVGEAFHKSGIKPQLRAADRQKIAWALILGQKEALDGTVILRNMESGVQETIDLNLDALVPVLKKRLRREE